MKVKTGSKLLCLAGLLMSLLILASCGQANDTPSHLISSGDSFTVTAELVGEIPSMEDFRIMQGGCVTEDYAYFAMVDDSATYYLTKCRIVKYDLETMQEVARSEVLSLGHANDITYVPDTDELYVIHCVNKKVSVLDPDTLVVKGEKRLDMLECYAIEYCEARDGFVGACSTAAMGYYDRDLNFQRPSIREVETTLVTQGICADDSYVYHIMYSHSSNTDEPQHMIIVRDYDGNIAAEIPFDEKDCEPENISLVGNTFYIGVNNSTYTGGLLYKVTLVTD